jgi:methyl-accepting chemotaxis protein
VAESNNAAAQVSALRVSLGEARRLEAAIIALGASNTVETERLVGLWQKELGNMRSTAAELLTDPAKAAIFKPLVDPQLAHLKAYEDATQPILKQLEGAQIDSPVALAYSERNADKSQALLAGAEAIQAAVLQRQGDVVQALSAAGHASLAVQWALIGLTLAVILPALWLTLRSIRQPLDEALRLSRSIADGDLSVEPRAQGQGEMAELMRSLAAMQASLRAVVGRVRESAESIQVASSEVAVGNQDLSQRTEHTAANLQSTASSVDQLTGTVRHSADSARAATDLARSARDVAQRGGSVVAEVVTTMQQIHDSSRRISDIIGTIDGIAFQTNILALNAAVEAARAGEQGRGFAVVAGEVRSLAQRSAEAAREIKTLINASVERVENGAQLVSVAGDTMDEIVSSVRKVTDVIGQIGEDAAAQHQGISSVHGSITELDRMTQQNAALVEQSAAAAESLQLQARGLTQLVEGFRLTDPQAAPRLQTQAS